MIGILSKILGSGDVISKSLDLIDNMHSSSEEEIQAKAKAKTDVLAAYAPFKIAQRMLAFMFGFTYVICFAIVLGMTLSGSGNPDNVTKVMDQFSINYAMLLILGFYFGGGAVEGFMEKKGKK
jgi:quinol-cytochrome oxidoreductase complex cytochrome b subunit